MISGVCGGIAEYFDMDPTLVRVLFIIFSILWGTAVLAYIVGAIVMPYRPGEEEAAGSQGQDSEGAHPYNQSGTPAETAETKPATPGKGQLIFGVILVAIGTLVLMDNVYIFRNFFNWFWWHIDDYIIPATLILIGAALMMRGTGKKTENQE